MSDILRLLAQQQHAQFLRPAAPAPPPPQYYSTNIMQRHAFVAQPQPAMLPQHQPRASAFGGFTQNPQLMVQPQQMVMPPPQMPPQQPMMQQPHSGQSAAAQPPEPDFAAYQRFLASQKK
jgi:hypothetical protein